MKLNGNNIITDDDVTLTGSLAGKKLSDTLEGILSRTAKLEAYTKWIYKYGGVGGSGNGGGGGGSSSYSLYATLNDVQMRGQNISLGRTGLFPLYFKIQNPNGATFSVTYKYSTIDNSGQLRQISKQVSLSIDNNYEYSENIVLNNNAIITVTSVDSIYNVTRQAQANYVTSDYNLTTTFMNRGGEALPNEVFAINAKQGGLCVELSYEFAVKANVYTWVEFTAGNKLIVSPQQIIEDQVGKLKFDLLELGRNNVNDQGEPDPWEIESGRENDSAGPYSATVFVRVSVENQVPQTKSFTTNFTLIPENLYLLVQHEVGTVYYPDENTGLQPNITEPYNFIAGNITFRTKAYMGTSIGSPCTITYFVGDDETVAQSFSTTLRTQNNIKLYCSEEGWTKLNFRVACEGAYYPSSSTYQTYYIYVNKPTSLIDWPTATWDRENNALNIITARKGYFNFYRKGEQYGGNTIQGSLDRPFTSLRNYANSQEIRMSSSKDAFTATDIACNSVNVEKTNTILHLGFQYSEINADNAAIITAEKLTNGTEYKEILRITQNSIQVGNKTLKYYFPRTPHGHFGEDSSFHLLSLVSRYIKTNGTDHYYEVVVYVDGIIEGALQDYSNEYLVFDHLTFQPSNSIFNLVELDYLPTAFKQVKENGTDKDDLNSPTPEDLDVYQYYLKYRGEIVDPMGRPVTLTESNLLTYCSNVEAGWNGDIIVPKDTVTNIAQNLNVPTLILTVDERTPGEFKAALDKSYGENDAVPEWQTSLSWANGLGGEPKDITPNSELYPGAYWDFKIQGSSTRTYKCKNFTLELRNRDQNENAPVYLFSPNFSSSDPTTFLPEESFTLKADVVDSSHSNNTSIGRFVNEITNKFDTGITGPFRNYIKNCLDGFPIVVYINVTHAAVENGENVTKSTIYYQGIYNFNLGRESYFNLGYKNCNVFLNESGGIDLIDAGEGFTYYKVTPDENKLKNGLVVTEIQGNSPYFDFSQWDSTILFETFAESNVSNEPYMFGDFVLGTGINKNQATNILRNLVYRISKSGGYLFGKDLLRKRFSTDTETHCGYDDGYKAYGPITRPMYSISANGEYERDQSGKLIPVTDPETGEQLTETITAPLNQVPNYMVHYKKALDGSKIVYNTAELTDEDRSRGYNDSEGQEIDLINLIIGDPDENILPWFNYRSLSEYYTICMAFGLVDSVQKNMNLKSWNANTSENKGTFYAAFYDMDTCLGINNEGKETTYFAFSDYWQYTDTAVGSTVQPGQVTIFRDYSPPANVIQSMGIAGGDFYDTASSYLFAVAKYSPLVGAAYDNDLSTDVKSFFPNELWAKWRSSSINNTDKTQACLRSAEYFINNFFANNLEAVGVPLINMNYRNKYLTMAEGQSTFSSNNFEKFNGTRIEKAKDWLDGRFHILDAYFNLPKSTSIIQYYDENNIYTNIPTGNQSYLSDPMYSSNNNYNISNNEDITIQQDIFARQAGMTEQGSGNLDFTIKAKDYSPLIIKTANNAYRYLLGSNDVNYNILLRLSGLQTYNFFGSGAWTYLNSLNSFGFSSLYLNSKYLETLNATSNAAMNVTGDSIRMPSLTSLNLSGSNITGSITNLTGEAFPNLRSVNVSKNSLNLTISDSTCNSVNISNKTGGNVLLSNCDSLSEINLGSGGSTNTAITVLNSFTVNPVPLRICKTTSTNNSSGGMALSYTRIGTITLSNTEYSGGKSRISITNDNTVTSITLTGFAQVYIDSCPNLRSINISDPTNSKGDRLTNLYIKSCGNGLIGSSLKIGTADTPEGYVDLSDCNGLDTVVIRNCETITSITLPAKVINLPAGAFRENIKLEYLKGGRLGTSSYMYIKGSYVFYNCNKFTLLDGPGGQLSNLRVHEDTTDLSYLFGNSTGGGRVQLAQAREFLKRSVPENNNVTNISSLFHGQSITYSENDLKHDLLLSETSTEYYCPDMRIFKKASVVNSALAWCNISAWHERMFTFGQEVTGTISFSNYARYTGSAPISTTVGVLKNIIDKVDYLFWPYSNGWHTPVFKFLKKSGSNVVIESSVNMNDFFCPGAKNPTYLATIYSIGLYNAGGTRYIWSYTDNGTQKSIFTNEKFPALKSVTRFLFDKTYGDEQQGLDGLFRYHSGLTNTSDILNVNLSTPVNLYNLFNWTEIVKNNNRFFGWNTSGTSGSLLINKYIREDNFTELLNNVLASSRLTGLDNIFRNCTVILKHDSPDLSVTLPTNWNVTSANFTFDGFKCVRNTNTDDSITPSLLGSLSSNEGIPVDFSKVFSKITRLAEAIYTFRNVYMAESLPYNFFNKRASSSKTVYVKAFNHPSLDNDVLKFSEVEDSFVQGTLYKYTYNQQLTDLRGCFYGTRWLRDDQAIPAINARHFNGTEDDIPRNRIEILSTLGNLTEGQVYFGDYYEKDKREYYDSDDQLKTEDILVHDVSRVVTEYDNTEIYDLTDFIAENDEGKYKNNISIPLSSSISIYNFDVASSGDNSSLDKLFCPPDILYGCTTSCQIQSIFSNAAGRVETLEGAIPTHMMKNCKSVSLANVFCNLNILPRKLWVENDYSGSAKIRTIYYYIPRVQNLTTGKYTPFTESGDLSSAFNFHLMLPDIGSATNVSIGGNIVERITQDAYYILLEDSISGDVTSLANAFPSVNSGRFYGETHSTATGIWTGAAGKIHNYIPLNYNIMYTPSSAVNETPHEEGEPFETYYTGTDGINITGKFKNLRLDNLINGELARWLCGHLFNETFSLENYKKTDNNKYIISLSSWDSTNYISSNLILPKAAVNYSFTDQKIFSLPGSSSLYLLKEQIQGHEDPGVLTTYETIGDNNRKVVVQNK